MSNVEQHSDLQHDKHCRRNGVWSIIARFATSGVACFLLNIIIVWLGTEIFHFHYMIVFGISWIVVLFLGFVLHRNWTFQATSTQMIPQFIRYVAVNFGQIVSSSCLMYIIVGYLHLTPWKASTLIAAAFAIINFFIHKNWSFATEKRP